MDISRIVKEIEEGNLVITPTDTVYGIMAKALDIDVINKVIEAKKRSKVKSFIVLVNGDEMLSKVAKNITPVHKELIKKYCPHYTQNNYDLEVIKRTCLLVDP